MRPLASRHRIARLFYTLFLFSSLLTSRAAASRQSASPIESGSGQNSAQLPPSTEVPPLVTSTSDQAKTEQYTLSHEKYQKAVAYSRAEYALYFVSYILGAIFLFLILRLGIAARLRDIAESISQNRWVQGLVFVPLLRLLVGVLGLPVRIYWHRLSLYYEQSVQGWDSWFWDWTKGQCVILVF